jgi:hypothetical protein
MVNYVLIGEFMGKILLKEITCWDLWEKIKTIG